MTPLHVGDLVDAPGAPRPLPPFGLLEISTADARSVAQAPVAFQPFSAWRPEGRCLLQAPAMNGLLDAS
ncbi:hypothetical protein GUJ93_ZPchr0015g6816 [Zizania palustris]|uniref:Uncharacterized protein n=1 Tax=Zizania palustris TaxID=103762 RepID=A0A8J5THC4_ZIZPA|nr:hypothetical protein GUJ93_ZPchr0015g6816 [Zizania palustris]